MRRRTGSWAGSPDATNRCLANCSQGRSRWWRVRFCLSSWQGLARRAWVRNSFRNSMKAISRCTRCGYRVPASPSRSKCRKRRSEEHTSELQSLMRISYAVFCLKKKTQNQAQHLLTEAMQFVLTKTIAQESHQVKLKSINK